MTQPAPTPRLFKPRANLLLCQLYHAQGTQVAALPVDALMALANVAKASAEIDNPQLDLWTRITLMKLGGSHFLLVLPLTEDRLAHFVFHADSLPVFRAFYDRPETGDPVQIPEGQPSDWFAEEASRRAEAAEAEVKPRINDTQWWLTCPENVLAYMGSDAGGDDAAWEVVNLPVRLSVAISTSGEGIMPDEMPSWARPAPAVAP